MSSLSSSLFFSPYSTHTKSRLSLLGEGGFGKIYLGFDIEGKAENNKGRIVAIKQPTNKVLYNYAQAMGYKPNRKISAKINKINAIQWAKLELGQKFSQEALLTARLSTCENVVSILDHDIRTPYIVLQYCNGGTLKERVAQEYNGEKIEIWAQQIATALDAAHSLKPDMLIHRDLKPDNILFDNEVLKVSGFGTSMMKQESESLHSLRGGYTPRYAAPEAFAGKAYPQTDIWSLGVILYELITRTAPFTGENIPELMNRILTLSPDDINEKAKYAVSSRLKKLVMRSLEKEIENRPQAKDYLEPQRIILKSKNLYNLKKAIIKKQRTKKQKNTLAKRIILITIVLLSIAVYITMQEPDKNKNNSTKQPIIKKNNNKEYLGFTYLRKQSYNCNEQNFTVKEYLHNQTGIEFIAIPAGEFMMGSNAYEDESPVHKIKLETFLIAKTEITQGTWFKIMGTTPWKGKIYVKEGNNYPATHISWSDSQEFCKKVGLSLPTEAQWEYACRSGSSHKYFWRDNTSSDYAWYKNNSSYLNQRYAHQVAQKKSNAFGLYDMSGNVWEWCADWYSDSYYYSSPTDNPKGPLDGRNYVLRGGSWDYEVAGCRSAYRGYDFPAHASSYVGFRPVYTLIK